MSGALHDLTVAQLAARLRAKDVSAVEAAQHFLARGGIGVHSDLLVVEAARFEQVLGGNAVGADGGAVDLDRAHGVEGVDRRGP